MVRDVPGRTLLARLESLSGDIPTGIHGNMTNLCEMLAKFDNTIVVSESHPVHIAITEMRAAFDRMTRTWLKQKKRGRACIPNRADWTIFMSTSKTIVLWLEGRNPDLRAERGMELA